LFDDEVGVIEYAILPATSVVAFAILSEYKVASEAATVCKILNPEPNVPLLVIVPPESIVKVEPDFTFKLFAVILKSVLPPD
jgi:hypothetical protein